MHTTHTSRLYLIVAAICQTFFSSVPTHAADSASFKNSANNVIIIFDIDDVLLTIPRGAVTEELWRHKGAVVRGVNQFKVAFKLLKQGASAEEWQDALEKAGNSKLAECIRHIGRRKVPINGMVELLQELRNKGYALHVASNMGARDFAFYQERYPALFAAFDAAFVIDYEQTTERIKKPDQRYFEQYRAQYPTSKAHLFIDDKKRNCQASGFEDTIAFKNPSHLRTELKARGIL